MGSFLTPSNKDQSSVLEFAIALLICLSILGWFFPFVGLITILFLLGCLIFMFVTKDKNYTRIVIIVIALFLLVPKQYQLHKDYFTPPVVEFSKHRDENRVPIHEIEVTLNREDIAKIEYVFRNSKTSDILDVWRILPDDKIVTTEGMPRGSYYLLVKVYFDQGLIKTYSTDGRFYVESVTE